MTTNTTFELTGTIVGVDDCGTIVVVRLSADDGPTMPVYFERLPFCSMLICEGCATPEELIGRPATYDGEGFRFED
jgi:hypothetical protein